MLGAKACGNFMSYLSRPVNPVMNFGRLTSWGQILPNEMVR